MVSEPRAPLGYCPHCAYPMDPGRCPECGQDIPSQRLDARPGRRRRRRRARRVLALILLFLAGYTVHWMRDSPPVCPAIVLLLLQGDENHWATIELARRHAARELTPWQTRWMFDKALVVGPLRVPQGPYPLCTPIPVSLECRFRLPPMSGPLAAVTRVELTARIDQHKPAAGALVLRNDLKNTRDFTRTVIEGLESADPGNHIMTADLAVTVLEGLNDPPPDPYSMLGLSYYPPPPSENSSFTEVKTWKFTRSVPFALEDRTCGYLTKAVYSVAPEEQVGISVRRDPSSLAGRVVIRCPAYSLTLSGHVWARSAGRKDYELIGWVGICGGRANPKGIEAGFFIPASLSGCYSTESVDVRIIPDLDLPHGCDGVSEYYGSIIERRGVRVEVDPPRGADD